MKIEVSKNKEGYVENYLAKYKGRIEKSLNAKNEICVQSEIYYPRLIEDEGYDYFDSEHIPFYYVSDIHISHKVMNHFKDGATKEEVYTYIKKLAREMVQSVGRIPYGSYLLIAGDTCSKFEWLQVFFEELVEKWKDRKKIVVISGNHELWSPKVDMEENIAFYREYYKKLGVTFLHNDLLIINGEWNHILHERELLELDEISMRKLALTSPVMILGGIGFSGLNEKYNATTMRYGKSFEMVSSENAMLLDKKETYRFDRIYRKIKKIFPNNKIIVLTHMKKNDWNDEIYQSGWIYVNGHNHYNDYSISNQMTVYADNQIGYKSNSLGLKHFYIDNVYDIFAGNADGIFEITKNQYLDFNRGKHMDMQFGRNVQKIYMIKKRGIYMFFIYCLYSNRSKKEHLYLLNGGKICKLRKNEIYDLPYYEKNMEQYYENVHLLLDKYSGGQQKIAKFIKRLGGSGKIHGCIVDVESSVIDRCSYCHLFVNPVDGKVTPYFAWDMQSRTIYRDLKTMLESQNICKRLNDNYKKIEKESPLLLPTVQYTGELAEWGTETSMENEDSAIYKISRIIKSLQYIIDKDVIRIWNEELLNYDFVNRIRQANKFEDIMNDSLVIDMDREK